MDHTCPVWSIYCASKNSHYAISPWTSKDKRGWVGGNPISKERERERRQRHSLLWASAPWTVLCSWSACQYRDTVYCSICRCGNSTPFEQVIAPSRVASTQTEICCVCLCVPEIRWTLRYLLSHLRTYVIQLKKIRTIFNKQSKHTYLHIYIHIIIILHQNCIIINILPYVFVSLGTHKNTKIEHQINCRKLFLAAPYRVMRS